MKLRLLIPVLLSLLNAVSCSGKSATSTAVDPKTGESPYHRIQVKNTIQKHQVELSPCYDQYTATAEGKQSPNGSLKMDWRIDSSGNVQNAEVIRKSFADNPAVAALIACSERVISGWHFPEPDKKVYVVHHFHFGQTPKRQAPQFLPVKK
jgi:hypothetical protein